MAKVRLGIDIGGNHIAAGIVKPENGGILQKEEQDVEFIQQDEEYVLKLIEKYIERFSADYEIETIGIATPGNPKQEQLEIENLVNLGIKNLSFKNLEAKYKIPINLKNDSKAAGLAEFKFGSLAGNSDAVFLCLGTGIGAAVFINGKLLQANRHVGFELGHMVIDKNGDKCNCGKHGCFETYCSIKRFKDKAKEILDIRDISPQELLEEIKASIRDKKSEQMEALINNYIDNLIIGISNIIDIFEPEIISLGGSFVFFKDIFYQKLIEEMEKRRYFLNKESVPKIVLANLKNDAGVIGAALD